MRLDFDWDEHAHSTEYLLSYFGNFHVDSRISGVGNLELCSILRCRSSWVPDWTLAAGDDGKSIDIRGSSARMKAVVRFDGEENAQTRIKCVLDEVDGFEKKVECVPLETL